MSTAQDPDAGPSKEPGGRHGPEGHELQGSAPADAVCRTVRNHLGDHADGELEPRLRRLVDEHVHVCRACDLELSRAEWAVLRLRNALKGTAVPRPAPSQDFTQKVMSRVRALANEEATAEALADFTPQVLARVRREWPMERTLTDRLQHGLRGGRKVLLTAAVIVIAVFAILLWPRPTPPLQVQVADVHGHVQFAGPRAGPDGPLHLQTGLTLDRAMFAAGGRLSTGPEGRVVLVIPPPGGETSHLRPTVLDLGPDTELVLAAGKDFTRSFDLHAGELELQTVASAQIRFGSAMGITCSGGRYRVSVSHVDRLDRMFLAEVLDRVRVEVLEGTVQVERGNLVAAQVGTGQVAHFDARSHVAVEPAPARLWREGAIESSSTLARSTERSGTDKPLVWVGRALDATSGAPVVGASVQVWTAAGRQVVVTDQQGQFVCVGLDERDAPVLAQVSPRSVPGEGRRLADFGPEPLALGAAELVGGERRLPPLSLPVGEERRGVLTTADGRVVPGAVIVPALVDGLAARIQRLPHLAAVTDQRGAFTITGLPGKLPPHTVLVAMAEVDAPGSPELALRILGSQNDVTFRLPAVQEVLFRSLPPLEQVVVCESLPGLPEGMAFGRRLARVDERGELRVAAVAGRLWLQLADGRILAGIPDAADPTVLLATEMESSPLQEQIRDLVQVSERFVGRFGHRFERPAALRGGAIRYVSAEMGGTPFARPGTRIFLVTEAGEMHFLGEYDGLRALPFEPPAEGIFHLLGIGPDGAVGAVAGSGEDRLVPVPIPAPGSVIPSPALRERLARLLDQGGAVVLRFDWVGGPLPDASFHRVVENPDAPALEGLPAGRYRVMLPDGSTGSVLVRAGERVELAMD